jgi:glutamyl-tRNA reductase
MRWLDASAATVFMVETGGATVPSGEGRELGIPESAITPLVKAIRGAGALEAAVLATEGRTECYVVAASAEEARSMVAAALTRVLAADVDAEAIAPSLVVHQGQAAVRHLFRLASGLEALVLGDGQLRQAYESAHAAHATGPIVGRVFRAAMASAVRARALAAGLEPLAAAKTTAPVLDAAIEAELARLDDWRVRRDAFSMMVA